MRNDFEMDLGLRDRTYLVTGGSRGLGRAGAEALVADGANVVISSRDADSVRAAVDELGAQATGVPADLGDPGTPARLIESARRQFGRLDGALISVGGPPAGTLAEVTEEQWQQAFDTVFLGSVRLATAVAAELGDGGALAFVLSSSVRAPIPNLVISNGLRPGLAMVAKSMAKELAPRGIRVNGLLPGAIETDRMRETAGTDTAVNRAARARAIPLGRFGQPAEFGRVAAFVLSPAASYLTGVMLPVDGGAAPAL